MDGSNSAFFIAKQERKTLTEDPFGRVSLQAKDKILDLYGKNLHLCAYSFFQLRRFSFSNAHIHELPDIVF